MRLCRFDNDRLGLVRGERIIDVSAALHSVPVVYWPLPPGDLLVANLTRLRGPIQHMEKDSDQRLVHECALRSPIANPTKILCAPLNYRDTGDTSVPDGVLERDGLDLKAVTALTGPADGVELTPAGREYQPSVQLAVVIGAQCRDIKRNEALARVAGYCVALELSLTGTESGSLRRSPDGFCVLGPWLVTSDELIDPDNLGMWMHVNGQPRQRGQTGFLIADVTRLIEYASSFYTLYPGDILLAGSPPGSGTVAPGDVIDLGINGIGSMRVVTR